MAQSKNARTSKPKVMEIEKKVRPKKEFILVELTKEAYREYREVLSEFQGKQVEEVVKRFGKTYLKVKNL
jgi:chaperonin GroEL (HSP60 family)